MGGEIFFARTDVEPFPFVQDHAADLASLPDPFRQDRNVGKDAPVRNSLENRPCPDADAREIEPARVTVSICDVHDAIALDGHIAAMIRFAQSERHVVSGPEMFVE